MSDQPSAWAMAAAKRCVDQGFEEAAYEGCALQPVALALDAAVAEWKGRAEKAEAALDEVDSDDRRERDNALARAERAESSLAAAQAGMGALRQDLQLALAHIAASVALQFEAGQGSGEVSQAIQTDYAGLSERLESTAPLALAHEQRIRAKGRIEGANEVMALTKKAAGPDHTVFPFLATVQWAVGEVEKAAEIEADTTPQDARAGGGGKG